ncbi:MAG: hypothetical protein ABGX40_08500 [Methylococcales bacterium]|jgi:hypothetical protein
MLNYFRFPLFFLVDILLTLCAFIGIVLVSILLLFFYCLYRFIWLFSGAAAIARHKQRFEQRQNRLLLSAKKQRSDYSMHADRQDIVELIQHINQHLQTHQPQLDTQVVNELHYLLGRCLQSLNFDKTLYIHAIVTGTDSDLLNAVISKLVNETTILD